PLPEKTEEEGGALSDVEFASMLKDIDTFSAQFSPPLSNDTEPEALPGKSATLPGSLKWRDARP
ncbi:MAG: hypothetical protein Q8L39_14250, partial [Burkholderiales bacterium]|nr:hypothetical protein [Burkholderiales bacterium]